MDDKMRERRALEQKRALQRKKRQRQIIRRTSLTALTAVLVVAAFINVKKGIDEKKETDEKKSAYGSAETVAQKEVYSVPDSQDVTYEGMDDGAKKTPGDIKIVIDPGHGGKDSGTLWNDVYEKDINLAIAKKLEALLKEQGYQVIMTRADDSYPVLSERIRVVEENEADLFVSIHQNAVENSTTIQGIEIYCNENSNSKSDELARAIHGPLLAQTGAKDLGVITDSEFVVVENNPVPACLIETGFLTTPGEREKLLDDGYQGKLARGIFEGIETFLEENIHDKRTSK